MEKQTEEMDEIAEMEEVSASLKAGSISREELLSILGNGVRVAYTHATKERIRNEKAYKLRLDSIHALSHAANVTAGVLKDLDLGDITARLDALEKEDEEVEE